MPRGLQPPPFNSSITKPDMPEEWKQFLLTAQQRIDTGLAPSDAPFITTEADASLTAATNLGVLTTGYLKATTALGVAAISSVATIPTTEGGTGLTSYVLGDVLYGSAANVLSTLAGNITATLKVLSQIGTGAVSAAPAWLDATTVYVPYTGATSDVDLGAHTLTTASVITPAISAAAAITVTPLAGTNLNIVLSTTGDFIVNTDQFTVDTSTGNVGIGTTVAPQGLTVDRTRIRVRQTGSTRFRSDWSVAAGQSSLNAFDDTGGVYLRLQIDANPLVLASQIGQSVGISVTPTARLHVPAGTTSANTAPFKFTSGPLLTTAEAGAVEFLTDAYYGTITTGAARKTFAFLESPVFTTPNLGTPSAGVLTNCTGTAAGLTAGTVTTNANLTGVITSVGNVTSIASQTGTGTKFVVDTSPTLVTPVLGVATGTSLQLLSTGNLGIGLAPTSLRQINTWGGNNADTTANSYYGAYFLQTLLPSANSAASITGVSAESKWAGTGTATNTGVITGFVNNTYSAASSTGVVSDMRGFNSTAYNQGAGIITNLYVNYARWGVASSGGITVAYGLYLNSFNSSTGVITTNYGIKSLTPTNGGPITTNYGAQFDNAGAAGITHAYGVAISEATGAATTNVTFCIGAVPNTVAYSFYNASTVQSYFAGKVGLSQTAPLALAHLGAGSATANTAPLKFTSGTNLTTAEAGAMEYNGTNLFFTRAGTVRENVLVAIDNVTAPTTGIGVAIVNFYGSSATNYLGDPDRWLSVNVLGSTYKIPLYT